MLKHLDVNYSYGNDTIVPVSRWEAPQGQIPTRLVLPEDSEISRLTKQSESRWIDKLIADDAAKIAERAIITQEHSEFKNTPVTDPYIDIVWILLNASVFKIETNGDVSGRVVYAGNQLPMPVQVLDKNGSSNPISLEHGDSGIIRLRQYISRHVADGMVANLNRNVAIDFSLVGIHFKRILEGMVVDTFTRYGPRITIDEARRL